MTDVVIAALKAARLAGEKLIAYPGPAPKTTAEAFAIQTAVKAALGWRPVGWKIGCTSKLAQAQLGADGPFPGPVYAERLFRSGDHVPTHPSNTRVVEPEIAFTLGHDLPARGRDYAVDEVLGAVRFVHPAIEIVNPRLPNGFSDPVEWYIADGALSDALVLGPGVAPLAPAAYAEITVEARLNGRPVGQGRGANALDGPELALAWLANDLIAKGLSLAAGDVVTTGVVTPLFTASHGDAVHAAYSGIGEVTARF